VQEFQELMPDEETFRRVWQRVMPDERVSPIVVHGPGQGGAGPQIPSPPRPQGQGTGGDEGLLRQMLEELDRSLSAIGGIVRRYPGAKGLWESLNRSASRLRSAWFLLTGRRWMGRPGDTGRNVPPGSLLREQYVRELELSRLYRAGRQEFRGEDLKEILPELEKASLRRREMIRGLLSRI
jgi:hypothetical protein